jgi:hypothetical protein
MINVNMQCLVSNTTYFNKFKLRWTINFYFRSEITGSSKNTGISVNGPPEMLVKKGLSVPGPVKLKKML